MADWNVPWRAGRPGHALRGFEPFGLRLVRCFAPLRWQHRIAVRRPSAHPCASGGATRSRTKLCVSPQPLSRNLRLRWSLRAFGGGQ